MSIELVIPSNHLILCHALLLLPSIFPSIRVFSNELVLCIRQSKYWSFSFSISHEYNDSNLESSSFSLSNFLPSVAVSMTFGAGSSFSGIDLIELLQNVALVAAGITEVPVEAIDLE